MSEGLMYYLLLFVGLIGVALVVAISPLIFRFLEYFFPIAAENDGVPARTTNPQSIERSEMHDEIRRLTSALETGRRDSSRVKELQ